AGQLPTVAVGGRGLDVALPRPHILANDNHLAGTLAVRHLIELGHTRIAHIHGLPSVAGRLRMQGYEDPRRAAGLGDGVHIEAGDMSEEGGYRATVRLLSGPDRPTAIFAANDLTCVGALSAAAALGVRVPEELSLVGFDNSVFARLRALWLTSVDATAFELGQRAARMLLARIERPATPGETVLLPPRLEVRGSSGPAPPRPAPPGASPLLAHLRELALEGLDGAVAPAVGQGLGHGIGEDVLLAAVHRVEDGARDGLRGGLRDVEVPGHVGLGWSDQDGVDPHTQSGPRGEQSMGKGYRG